ncbi:MAG: hypothetical protein AAF902_07825 [Chloroflexota bacterium]
MQVKNRKHTLILSLIVLIMAVVISPAKAATNVVFNNGHVAAGWSDWSWSVERNGANVKSEAWGGVYLHIDQESGFSVDDYSSLVVSADVSGSLLVGIVADVDQPVIEIKSGETEIDFQDLALAGTKSFEGIQIRSPEATEYTLNKVELKTKTVATTEPSPPMATPVPTMAEPSSPTATPIPPTATSEPTATSTSLPPTATPTTEPTDEPAAQPTQTTEPTATQPAPTAEPTAAAAQPEAPVQEQTGTNGSSPTCGGLLQQAEHGQLFGKMRSENGLIYVPSGENNDPSNRSNRADYCVNINTSGIYQIKGWVHAKDGGSDTAFFEVNGKSHLWDMSRANRVVEDWVNDRGKSDPVRVRLTTGAHRVSIIHRESDAKVDRFQFVLIKADATPTPIPPTATPLPPTATPTPQVGQCGGLTQEAENGKPAGEMRVVNDSRASSGRAVKATGSGKSIGDNRLDFCVRIYEAGHYQIRGRIFAPDDSSNSVLATINNQPAGGMTWHVRANGSEYKTHFVSSGGSPSGNNPAVTFEIKPGNYQFSIYQRESNFVLDKIQFMRVDEPEPPAHSCGAFQQEAENGKRSGVVKLIEDSSASGRQAVGATTRKNDPAIQNDRVDFCMTVAEAGNYHLAAWVKTSGLGGNSMYVVLDGMPTVGQIWHMDLTNTYSRQVVSIGGNPEGGNPGKTFQLSAGDHMISFYHREPGVVLDRIELVRGSAPEPPQPPEPPQRPDPGDVRKMLPREAQIDYSNAGISGGIPNYPNTIWVQGRTEADIERAIRDAKPYTKIMLPAGTYNIGTIDINKSHIALVGAGNSCGNTVLRFGSNDSGIRISNNGSIGSSTKLTATAYRNSTTIKVGNGSSFNRGDYVFIQQNDDSSLFRRDLSRNPTEDWVRNNSNQINKVVAKSGNTLTLEGGLNLDYKTSLNARVAKVNNMVVGVGIENITIERTKDDYAIGDSANLFFWYTANSWVSGVHSKNAVRAHVYFKRSYKGNVTGNYLDRAFNNGPGGHGYGVRLQDETTDMLVENNIGRLLRHSYLVQSGGNGNVFGYNYSADPYGEGFGEIYTDLSVHGGMGHSNLFEGNQAQHAKVDNIHASNPANVFFRNRLEQDIDNYTYKSQLMSKGASTPHIWVHENQYFNAFLANEIGFPGANKATQTKGFSDGRTRDNFTVCKFTNSSDGERGCGRTRDTTVNHGTHDYLTGRTTWDSSIHERGFPSSLYLSGKPSFWGNSVWPMFGPDRLGLSESQKVIPAKARYLSGDYCAER